MGLRRGFGPFGFADLRETHTFLNLLLRTTSDHPYIHLGHQILGSCQHIINPTLTTAQTCDRSQAVSDLAEASPARLNLMVFSANLLKDSGTVADLRVFGQGQGVRDAMFSLAFADPTKLLLTSDPQYPQLSTTYVHGGKRGAEYVGFQLHAMGSLKCYLTPGCSGRVVALEWLSLQRFLVQDQGSQGDLANARAFLQTCSSQEVTAMVEAGVQCCYHEIQSGDLLCLPLGWLIAEQTCSVSSNGFQATFLYGSRQTRCALLPLMHMAPPENTSPQVAEGVKLMKAALAALEVSGGVWGSLQVWQEER